jgi:hypothetical protein
VVRSVADVLLEQRHERRVVQVRADVGELRSVVLDEPLTAEEVDRVLVLADPARVDAAILAGELLDCEGVARVAPLGRADLDG